MIEILAAAGALGVAGYAALVEPRRLAVRELRVPAAGLPREWRPLRVAVLSDLHAAWPHVTAARIGRIVSRTLAARPDIVVLPGDFVCHGALGTRPVPIEAVAEALAPLPASVPTYAVLGNHDHDVGARRVAGALEAAGLITLYNRAEHLARPGGPLWIAGVDCLRTGRADLPQALAQVPENAPVLLLSHVPDIIRRVPDRVMLTISGHTHGGQICVPGYGPLVTMSRLPRRMARGLHRLDSRYLFVSTGIGTSGLPMRLAAIPEVALLTVEPATAEPTTAAAIAEPALA